MPKRIASELITDGGLYASEKKIHPRDVDGIFDRLRTWAVFILLGLYYLSPWLQWSGRQAVLFDLPARKFYILGLVFWPQDFFFLALLLVMAGLSLFFFTALAGRLWCGYACPQTVWTEVFVWMERWTEGDRNQRMKLDAAPWSWNKLRRRGSRHLLWAVFALWTGLTFVGFFTPIRDLAARLWPFAWSGWETFWVLFYSLATWGNAGVLREQVCKYMCPYARFQSAMFDRNTLIISYDARRGETRGPRKKSQLASVLSRARGLLGADEALSAVIHSVHVGHGSTALATTGLVVDAQHGLLPPPVVTSPEDLGDCIDCTICVQVCPTGIDIRNGLQYECIACGACIDACDSVMDKMGYPHGLIRYTTQNAVDGKPSRVLRPRIFVYGALLGLLFAGTIAGIAMRKPLIVDVIRDRQLYRVVDAPRSAPDRAARIENSYTLRVINKDSAPHRYRLSIDSDAPITLDGGSRELQAASEEVLTLTTTLQAASGAVRGRADVRFVITDLDTGLVMAETTRFFGPVQ